MSPSQSQRGDTGQSCWGNSIIIYTIAFLHLQNSSQNAVRTTSRGTDQRTSLELPRITQSTPIPPAPRRHGQHSSNSVISVNKYLQITSHQQPSLPEEEEDGENEEKETDKMALLATSQSRLCQPGNAVVESTSLSSASGENPPQV